MGRPFFVPSDGFGAGMRAGDGTNAFAGLGVCAGARNDAWCEFAGSFPTSKCVDGSVSRCARNHVCVMLHLRARYVSKAAILTIPMPQSIGRKSKSRLNSKGLDR
jgi:hypothetical protein